MATQTPDITPGAVQGGAAPAAQAQRRLGMALAVIATAQLMVVLDLTIVTVALPQIPAPRSRLPGTLLLVSPAAATMPMGWFAGPDASLAGTG